MSALPPGCPDENLLVGYVAHVIEEDARASVEAHLADCETCSALVSDLLRYDDEGAPRSHVPDPIVSSRKDTFPRERFGKYQLESVLGQGAMGTVYAARDEALDRRVALKILRPDANAEGARGRLLRESRAMAKLAHPNVVTVYDAGELFGRLYISMELVDGVTFGGWLRAEARAWQDALALLLHAGEGLHTAHTAGLVHRDFKPENVLVGKPRAGSQEPRVVVTDFGLVSGAHDEAPERASPLSIGSGATVVMTLTRSGMMIGTPRYMSPEQFSGAKTDARSDQFSFAVSLYEALYKHPPFRGATLDDLKKSVCSGALEEPPMNDVPPAIFAAIRRALSTEPDDRYPSMAELLRDLARSSPAALVRSSRLRGSRIALASVGGAALLGGLFAVARGSVSHEKKASTDLPTAALAASASRQAAAFAPATGARGILVFDTLKNDSGDARLTGTVESLLARDLGCSLRLDAYSPASLTMLAEELGATTKTPTPSDLVQRASEQGRAAWLVTGTLERVDRKQTADGSPALRLAITATNPAAPAAHLDVEAEGDSAEAIGSIAETAGERLRSALRIAPSAEGAAPPSPSWNLDALKAWSDGRAKMTARSWEAAIVLAERALAADPALAVARMDDGISLNHDSRQLEAIAALQATVANPGQFCERERLVSLGHLYGMQDQFTPSSHAYQQYLTLWPSDLATEGLVAGVMINGFEYPLALDVAKASVNEHPKAAAPRATYISALFFSGDYEGVVREGERLSAADREHFPRAVQRWISTEAFLGHDDVALRLIEEQSAFDAENSDEQRADLAAYRGHLSTAEAILKKRIASLVAESDLTYARTENIQLAELLWRKGDAHGARKAAEDALVDADKEASNVMLYRLGRLFAELHADRDAAVALQALGARTDHFASSYATLLDGDLLREHGQTKRAQGRYEDALKLQDAWRVHERLGELALETGAYADAVRELTICFDRRAEGSAALEPDLHSLSSVSFDLARAKDGGKQDDALAAYRAFLAIEHDPDVDDPSAAVARKRVALLEAKN